MRKILAAIVLFFAVSSNTGCVSATQPDWQQVREVIVTADAIVYDYQLTLGDTDPELVKKLDKIHAPATAIVAAIDTGKPDKALVKLATDTALAIINDIDDPKKKQTALRIYFGIVTAIRLTGLSDFDRPVPN